MSPGCEARTDGATLASCDRSLAELLVAGGLLPDPTPPYAPEASVWPTDEVGRVPATALGAPGSAPPVGETDTARALLVDPSPALRGDHRVERWVLPDDSCTPVAALQGYTTVAAVPPPLTRDRPLGRPGAPDRTLRALVVTGTDPGASEDVAAWDAALDALGVAGRHVHAPTRAEAEAALADLCAVGGADRSALLVVTGRATKASGGALRLDREAWSFDALLEAFGARCEVAMRVVVADVSHAGRHGALAARAAARWPPDGRGWVYAASSPAVPSAARVAADGGGALSAGLAAKVAERAMTQCADITGLGPAVVADLFRPDGVRQGAVEARWAALGHPAVAGGASEPSVRAWLDGAVPEPVGVFVGSPLGTAGCATDVDCSAALDGGCPAGPCLRWACIEGACRAVGDAGAACDDGNACTEGDRCDDAASCAGTLRDCRDSNPCTQNPCDPAVGCLTWPVDALTPCDDGDPCTVDEACDGDGACAGTAEACDDGDPCTIDTCTLEEYCVHTIADIACDDGDPCTDQDFCDLGQCGGEPTPCDDGEVCTADLCDSETGDCEFLPRADGTACHDGDICTTLDRCTAGVCAGQPTVCDDGIPCTLDVCEGGVCSHLPEPGTCATGSGCVPVGSSPGNDPCRVCAATGVMVATPGSDGVPCPGDGIPCTDDQCQGGECVHLDGPDSCHLPDGTCVSAGQQLAPCVVCQGGGIATTADDGPCDDGDPCTEGDSCVLGVCQGDLAPCCPVGDVLACGATTAGDSSAGGAGSSVSSWSCLVNSDYQQPEGVHRFVAPCSGTFSFAFAGVPGQLVFMVRGGLEACGAGTCESWSGSQVSAALSAGEEVHLVVDGVKAGGYLISTSCPCGG